jgi:hypothetical protein
MPLNDWESKMEEMQQQYETEQQSNSQDVEVPIDEVSEEAPTQ